MRRSGAQAPGPATPAAHRYHHGALREALVAAAEALLAERGVEGFTLREAARRAGVSAAAPAHHFDNAAGLLTEIAVRAHHELAAYLRQPNPADASDAARLRTICLGYVRFGMAHPARFELMGRPDLLIHSDLLEGAAALSQWEIERGVRRYLGVPVEAPLDIEARSWALAAWAMVHGFARLAVEGRFGADVGPQGPRAFAEDRAPAILSRLIPERAGSPPD